MTDIEYADPWLEEAWAHRCGFWSAAEYWAATAEAFAESVRDDWNGE